ncbi:MAG: Flp family type IVb pilin [Desulfobacterales bacterium]|nr:Flp family type IVb pilin [Desulfobacterales bacterium]
MNAIIGSLKDENGATAIEYALVASLLAMAILGSVTAVGQAVLALYNRVEDAFPG